MHTSVFIEFFATAMVYSLVIIWSDGSYRYPSAALEAGFVGCRQSDPDDDMPD